VQILQNSEYDAGVAGSTLRLSDVTRLTDLTEQNASIGFQSTVVYDFVHSDSLRSHVTVTVVFVCFAMFGLGQVRVNVQGLTPKLSKLLSKF